jgi:hypothetical protein
MTAQPGGTAGPFILNTALNAGNWSPAQNGHFTAKEIALNETDYNQYFKSIRNTRVLISP